MAQTKTASLLEIVSSVDQDPAVIESEKITDGPHFSISEFASLLNCSSGSIRKWEREGKIAPAQRIKRGSVDFRYYTVDNVTETRKRLALPPLSSRKPLVQLFFNMKGGTGKSTMAYNYAAVLASMGHKVLAIDLDGQSHMTICLKVRPSKEIPTILEMIDPTVKMPFEKVVKKTWIPNLDLLPSSPELSTLELFFFSLVNKGYVTNSETILYNALSPYIANYDVIIVDTGPNLGLVNVNAMLMANDLIVPVKTDYLSVEGASFLLEKISEMQNDLKFSFDRIIILPNIFSITENICRESLSFIQSNFGEYISKTVIRKSTAIAGATSKSEPVFVFDKKSTGTKDVISFVREVFKITPNEDDYWV